MLLPLPAHQTADADDPHGRPAPSGRRLLAPRLAVLEEAVVDDVVDQGDLVEGHARVHQGVAQIARHGREPAGRGSGRHAEQIAAVVRVLDQVEHVDAMAHIEGGRLLMGLAQPAQQTPAVDGEVEDEALELHTADQVLDQGAVEPRRRLRRIQGDDQVERPLVRQDPLVAQHHVDAIVVGVPAIDEIGDEGLGRPREDFQIVQQHLAPRGRALDPLDQVDQARDVHARRLDMGPAGIEVQRTAQVPTMLERSVLNLHAPQPPDMMQHLLQRREEQRRRRMKVRRPDAGQDGASIA
ncbi:hypothetical protein D3C77_179020 [compost metagenome]